MNFSNMNGTELIFWSTAIFGTIFFIIRIILMILGMAGTEATEGSIDTEDFDSTSTDPLTSSDAAFKLLSLTSITGFFMMFGWMGLAAYKQFQLNVFLSFIIAFFSGILTMYITGLLFKLAMKLTSSGTVFNIDKTIGLKGSVYLKIPIDGPGQIQIIVDDQTRMLEAISEDKIEIDSFKEVVIVRVVDLKTVAVKKI